MISDTPRDVEAALKTGSEIIAVCTGIHSQAELAPAPVDLPNLADTHALLALLDSTAAA